MAESSRSLNIRAMVLPPIPLSLRASWNLNSEKLTRTGMFHFLAWIQIVIMVAYVTRVFQFIQSYFREIETAQVDGRTIDCSVTKIERLLKWPSEGQSIEDMWALNKHQFTAFFEGNFPRNPKGCRLDSAKPQWKLWFRFVNDYLVLRPQRELIAQRMVVAAMKILDGEKINWA